MPGGTVEVGPIRPMFETEEKWFVYPQKDDEVWTFDGRDHLIVTIFGEGHPDNVSWHQNSVEVRGRKMPPEGSRDRLRKSFLETLDEK